MDVQKPLVLPGSLYTEATERCASFNTKFLAERKNRLPYLDSQTGVVQNSSNLWKQRFMRLPGKFEGQLYSYPEKRWKRSKKVFKEQERKAYVGDEEMPQLQPMSSEKSRTDADESAAVEPQAQTWYDDDQLSDKLDGDDIENYSDGSDYDDYVPGRNKKTKKTKGAGRGRGRRKMSHQVSFDASIEDVKPYPCSLCPARYKTRPGLTYHYAHVHGGEPDTPEPLTLPPAPPVAPAQPVSEPPQQEQTQPPIKRKRAPGERATPNEYCDFCLKDAFENKNGEPEELCCCSDCGRAGHPTCLQFTPNMCISVKQYPWQCIECKSCGLCGTSDNDDQLLFCDDCDRGYHMYCLNPPLSEAPEGNWSCHLCIAQFYGGKKPPNMA